MQSEISFYPLLISALLLIGQVIAANQHSSRFKSIHSTDDECHQYLSPQNGGNCSTRCRGVLQRFWNAQRGLGISITQFYQPDPEDRCYLNRTVRCLRGVSSTDTCERVDKYVQCFKDHYGKQDMEAARFIPFTSIQHAVILMECAAVLGISEDSLKQAVENGTELPQQACLLRCFLIRQGLYSDAGGFDLERLEMQCGGYGSGWDPKAVGECIAKVEDCDKCAKVQRIAKDCLQAYFNVLPNPNKDTSVAIPFLVEFSVGFSIFGINFQIAANGCLLGIFCFFA
nr:general odorant-binding protein 45-like [Aedes albopictus]